MRRQAVCLFVCSLSSSSRTLKLEKGKDDNHNELLSDRRWSRTKQNNIFLSRFALYLASKRAASLSSRLDVEAGSRLDDNNEHTHSIIHNKSDTKMLA